MSAMKKPQAGGRGAVQDTDEYNISPTVAQANWKREREQFEADREASLKLVNDDDFEWPTELEALSFDERQRAWWFIAYPESLRPHWLSFLIERGVVGAVSPLHDRDRWPDGDIKKPHFHILIYQSGKTSYQRLMKLVNAVGGVRLEPVANIVGACRYLAHLDIQPDKVPEDVGKVRYSVDDIVTLNGFDIMAYVKATQTQISQALKELYVIIEDCNITAYWEFLKFIYTSKPEYEFVMSNAHVCRQVESAIRSRYAIKHKNDAFAQAQLEIAAKDEQIDELLGAVKSLKDMVEKIGDFYDQR